MKQIQNILNYTFEYNKQISISVKSILILIVIIVLTSFLLRLFEKYIKRKLHSNDKNKFDTVFSFGKWLLYIIIFSITLQSSGVQVTAIFAASTALLIGVGLALQTFFQDIISGIFIIMDQSVHVGDYIEIDGKVGRVVEIKLRTTRAVTIENKVLVIPNHLYLKNSLYNWTQNGSKTKNAVRVGVAYGTDVQLVKSLLLQAAKEHKSILTLPEPMVLFKDFGDSSLEFELMFTIHNSFQLAIIESDLRFRINELFKQNDIKIPYPQRDVHIIN
ncbi:mechanosensitive ion channel family protein [Tenacibaculum amylolyticum]|uniref:mechanosensitive ion channel family protein n=1 Tax=Tenacibaculum amylolyticum TaxID=104269 RepID=UPI0038936687